MPRSAVLRAIFDWWIGETVGVLTVTPFLLIFVMPALKRFAEGQPVSLPARRSLSASNALYIWASSQHRFSALFGFWHVRPGRLSSHVSYFPAADLDCLQRGFKGISVALLALNSGVVLALWLFRFDPAQLGGIGTADDRQLYCRLADGRSRTERKQAEETLQQF